MSWWDSYRAVYRAELKASAFELADHGWPVLRGNYWQADRWVGAEGASVTGLAPLDVDGLAASRIRRRSMPGVGTALLGAAGDRVRGRRHRGVRLVGRECARGSGRPTWWFRSRPRRPGVGGSRSVPARRCAGARLTLGREPAQPGSWVAAPPSEGPQGVVHWRVPRCLRWSLPDPATCRWRCWRCSGNAAGRSGGHRARFRGYGVRS